MFWNIFVDLCDKNGTKPNPVAKKLNIASGTVTKWKNGSNPSGSSLQKIADHFNVSVDYLLGTSDQKEKAHPAEGELSETERAVLNSFRSLNEENQRLFLEFLAKL